MTTTTDTTIAHLLPLTSEERADLSGRYAAGAYDIGEDGIAYLVFRGEWISDEQVQALLDAAAIEGLDAIAAHRSDPDSTRLDKYTDPTEGAREGLSIVEAEAIAAEDPALIYLVRL